MESYAPTTTRLSARARVYGRIPFTPCGCSLPCLLILVLALAMMLVVAWRWL